MKEPGKVPWYYLFMLILAGESVFILPFVLQRVFRPTVLKVFNLDNVQLGLCFSVYGFVALVSYLFGGPLADRFPPRKLIAIALWSTALGGILFATFPDYTTLQLLYGFWGFTTIFLFWSPMIKATRVWGGERSQGRAFGLLDGGRGLVGALFGTIGVLVFSFFMADGLEQASLEESRSAFRYVILSSSGIVTVVGGLVWMFMKLPVQVEKKIIVEKITMSQVKEVLALPSVVLLMVIILCAYVGYKITDVFSLYAQDVMLYSEVVSAQVGTFLLFARPFVGVLIGVLADRSRPSLWLFLGFVIAFFGALVFAFGVVVNVSWFFFLLSILVVAVGVYAVRALYFSVMQSGKIPLLYTGTAVGLISLIGYTPDIFAGPVMGYLLDSAPGAKGHQHVFWMLAVFYFIGGVAAYRYFQLYGKKL